jgi:hypothetical protein
MSSPSQRSPHFTTMDRLSAGNEFGASLGKSFLSGNDPDANARLDVYGQYLLRHELGVYAAASSTSVLDAGDFEAVLGNIESGMLMIHEAQAYTLLARSGLYLPTASDSEFLNFANGFGRLTDLQSTVSETITARIGGSYLRRLGAFFLRADLGLDVPVHEHRQGAEFLVRANLGAGVARGHFIFTGELVNLATVGDPGSLDDILHSVAMGVQLPSPRYTPYISIVRPLDAEINGLVQLVIVLGLRRSFDAR